MTIEDAWQPIETAPENVEIMTKIDNAAGVRNEQTLVQRRRSPELNALWWVPDGTMYVYYTPTHWRLP